MRVFVAGATGILGRRIVAQLGARGHAVVGMVRDDAGAETLRSLEAEPCRASLFDADDLTTAVEGCEVVVHAATAIPTKVRTGPQDWALNDRIRQEGTRALTTAASRAGASVYLQQSVAWAVRGPDGRPFDEDAPPVSDSVLGSALAGERIARDAGESGGFETGILRCGVFYSSDSWHTRAFGESLRRGRPVLVGGGDAVWSFLHADDAARAFVVAAESPRTGVWHVIDDRPVSLSVYLGTLSRAIGTRPPRGVPRWLAQLVIGRYAAKLLTSSFATSNERFRHEFGWRPSYPTCDEGLDQVVRAWKSEGFLLGDA